ncbi:TetR/AcrR family transcriptional regulator [Nocardia sp. NPDC020380]|uniref:TetR/AcrR family transcriptional regulator n=1 Tax=Nocardia sp. NPDC020380 TaxID=3364309 RepID=UPI0037B17050
MLFFGQDRLLQRFSDGIAHAPDSATPLDAITAALDSFDEVFGPERRQWAQQLRTIVAGNIELQERELLKRTALTAAIADAFQARGLPEPAASLAAEFGSLTFRTAFAQWVESPEEQKFSELARHRLHELRTAATLLDR